MDKRDLEAAMAQDKRCKRRMDNALGYMFRSLETLLAAHADDSDRPGKYDDHSNDAELLAGHLRGAAELLKLLAADRWKRHLEEWEAAGKAEAEAAEQATEEVTSYTHPETQEASQCIP